MVKVGSVVPFGKIMGSVGPEVVAWRELMQFMLLVGQARELSGYSSGEARSQVPVYKY
jgi:hypothetical protein